MYIYLKIFKYSVIMGVCMAWTLEKTIERFK